MSVAKTVEAAIDIEDMAQAAQDCGYAVKRDQHAVGYSHSKLGNVPCNITIETGTGYSVGFLKDEVIKKVHMVYDSHDGSVEKIMTPILERYVTRKLKGRKILRKERDKKKVYIYVKAGR